jgi:Family of unknown function (DUF6348)
LFSWWKRRAVRPPEVGSAEDLAQRLVHALNAAGHRARRLDTRVETDDGFLLQPKGPDVVPLGIGSVRTCTTVSLAHPTLLPQGTFEFQHATGADAAAALDKGFAAWVGLDYAVLADALRVEPRHCMSLVIDARRVVLGPVAHLVAQPLPARDEDHPFCPCCLFTHALAALKPVIDDAGTHGMRLFAARTADGGFEADCRVDGEDWPAGAAALADYARTWRGEGLEFRKQYALVHTPRAAS